MPASSSFVALSTAAAANGTSSDSYTGPKYITNTIFVGLFVGFSLIGMGLFGVAQLMAIKPPLRFATAKLNVGKEY